MLIALILIIVLLSALSRLIASIFWKRSHRFYRYNPYGYDGCGCSHHHCFGGFLPILALVSLARLFTRRF